MGMYTLLEINAELRKDTPDEVLDTIRHYAGEAPDAIPTWVPRQRNPLNGYSAYFPGKVFTEIRQDAFGDLFLEARSSIKNYAGDIESFLEWLSYYVRAGSGPGHLWARTHYEEDFEPTNYYLVTPEELN